jgi:hypothetical protein
MILGSRYARYKVYFLLGSYVTDVAKGVAKVFRLGTSLKLEAERYSLTSATIYYTTGHHITSHKTVIFITRLSIETLTGEVKLE